jgi:hypothetical protein
MTATVMDGATATCLGCENLVILALTGRGAMLPLDPVPSPGGALAVSVPAPGQAPRVRYLRGEDAELAAGERRMVAHWDTHPACKGNRKDRKHAGRKGQGRKAGQDPGQAVPHAQGRKGQVTPARPAHHDMTLAELETANLDAILAAAGHNKAARRAEAGK